MSAELAVLNARQALQAKRVPALQKVQVEENDGQVVLSGSVSSYYLKQLAQEAIMPVLNRRTLLNQVRVIHR
jgi:hypothetical protein